jgi:hypothetical protein
MRATSTHPLTLLDASLALIEILKSHFFKMVTTSNGSAFSCHAPTALRARNLNYTICPLFTCRMYHFERMWPKKVRVLMWISENVEGYVEINLTKLSTSKLSKRCIYKILGTGKVCGCKYDWLWLRLWRLLLWLLPTAITCNCDYDCLQLLLHVLVITFKERWGGCWTKPKHTMCMLVVKREHQEHLRNNWRH